MFCWMGIGQVIHSQIRTWFRIIKGSKTFISSIVRTLDMLNCLSIKMLAKIFSCSSYQIEALKLEVNMLNCLGIKILPQIFCRSSYQREALKLEVDMLNCLSNKMLLQIFCRSSYQREALNLKGKSNLSDCFGLKYFLRFRSLHFRTNFPHVKQNQNS